MMPIRGDTIAHTREYAGGPNPLQSWAAPVPASLSPAPSGGIPGWGDISSLFREALASLTGEGEKAYQTGKRRTLADIAMQSINSGMANTLNLPAAGIAYDEANRPAFNTMLGQQKAGILTGLGQVGAGMYGQNLGAQTSLTTAKMGQDVDYARLALQQYLGTLKANQPQNSGSFYGSLTRV